MKQGKPSMVRIRCLKTTLKSFTETCREPPSMAEAQPYWKSLWGEEAQHNDRTEWIKREQKSKVSHMDWMSIRLRKLLPICLKLTIGNLLKMIKYNYY